MPRKKSHYHNLKNKWIDKHSKIQDKVLSTHPELVRHVTDRTKQLAIGSLGSLMLLTSPVLPQAFKEEPKPIPQNEKSESDEVKKVDNKSFLIHDLENVLPDKVRPLNGDEEKIVEKILTRHFNVPVAGELEGKKLNTQYGIIGAEQHLMRYPGDTMSTHFATNQESQKYFSSGMAPGRGAWGYFASSRQAMTQKDVDREKYYIAVQTFLSENFNSRFAEYRDFYKYRKMLVVNPQNGKGVVAVIGDAGPAQWTGKHLGGSPEVMIHLERVDGKRRGAVLYFFIDDPDDKIPLGPINLK